MQNAMKLTSEIEIYKDCITLRKIPEDLFGVIIAKAGETDGITVALCHSTGGIFGLNQKVLGKDGDKEFIEFMQDLLAEVEGKIIWHGKDGN